MDFVILKVNGVDVSGSQERALEELSRAQEPITVEIKRKEAENSCIAAVDSSCHNNQNNNEEEEEEEDDAYYDDDQLIIPDLEYQEIVLTRSSPAERLGLTLCYEAEDSMGRTEIFIDDIHAGGLAERDGRLRLGDQIVQIDGQTIWTKSQAQAKFLTAAANMRFLIARPPTHLHAYYAGDGSGSLRRESTLLDEDDEAEEDHPNAQSPLLLCGGKSGDEPAGGNSGHIRLLAGDSTAGGSSPRSRDSGNMSIDSDDKSFEIQRNRLSSSSSSKDGSGGGHRSSDSIDRSTTNSSKSEASSHDGSTTRSDPGKPEIGSIAMAVGSADMKKSQSLFSIDSDFMFVSTKLPRCSDERHVIRNQSVVINNKDCLNSLNNNNHVVDNHSSSSSAATMVDPIYEIIQEQSEPEVDMYCLPVDTVMTSSPAAGVKPAQAKMASPEHVAKKTRSRSSDQVKLLAKSTSGPINFTRLISQLSSVSLQKHQQAPEVAVSSSSAAHLKSILKKEPGEARLSGAALSHPEQARKINNRAQQGLDATTHSQQMSSSSPGRDKKIYYTTFKQPDIVYTNLDNLEQTIRKQQAALLQQQLLHQHHQQQHFSLIRSNSRGAPVFKAPPPPSSHRLPSEPPKTITTAAVVSHNGSGGSGHEQSTSFMGSEDETRQWEWKVKIRPDGSRYVARRPVRSRLLAVRAEKIAAERSAGGFTTDDDALSSDLRLAGKFCPRSERRQQLERQRQTRRAEELVRIKNLSLDASAPSAPALMRRPTTEITDPKGLPVVRETIAASSGGRVAFGGPGMSNSPSCGEFQQHRSNKLETANGGGDNSSAASRRPPPVDGYGTATEKRYSYHEESYSNVPNDILVSVMTV